jgi:hypothetical protein
MAHITRDSLMTLEAYARARAEFRARVMAHKMHRTIALGEHVTLFFEDELTIRYQIQEMLRAERTFEESEIASELDAYNPLIPDGGNWKATMMIEYPDEAERRQMLARLIGIEDRVWVQVAGHARVYAVADEDMERESAAKTAAVHFLRFDIAASAARALEAGAGLALGVDHPAYSATVAAVSPETRQSLANDLAS